MSSTRSSRVGEVEVREGFVFLCDRITEYLIILMIQSNDDISFENMLLKALNKGFERDALEQSNESVGSVHSMRSDASRSSRSSRGGSASSRRASAEQARGLSSLGGAPPIVRSSSR